jgi:hypothetical protein
VAVHHLYTKVVGVTRTNADGTRRQDVARRCRPGDAVILRHEPDNPADPNAIAVLRDSGEQIGYLRRALAKDLVLASAAGHRCGAVVTQVTGGGPFRYSGVNLVIIVADPGTGDEETQGYFRDLIATSSDQLERLGGMQARDDVGRSRRGVPVVAISVAVALALALALILSILSPR